MRVYIHIYNDTNYMDRSVQTFVTCDGIPRVGDAFYMDDYTQEFLELAALKLGYPGINTYGHFIYGTKGRYRLSFDDCVFVNSVLWRPEGGGIYACHISLNSTVEEEEERAGIELSKEEYDDVRVKYHVDHHIETND